MSMTTKQPRQIERHNYFSQHVANPQATITRARAALRNVDFDTFVVTGDSGVSLGSILAWKLGKNLVVVRKAGVECHDWRAAYGVMGDRWVFLDDLIDSGSTLRKCESKVKELDWEAYDYDLGRIVMVKPALVGAYLYAKETWTGKEYKTGQYRDLDSIAPIIDGKANGW